MAGRASAPLATELASQTASVALGIALGMLSRSHGASRRLVSRALVLLQHVHEYPVCPRALGLALVPVPPSEPGVYSPALGTCFTTAVSAGLDAGNLSTPPAAGAMVAMLMGGLALLLLFFACRAVGLARRARASRAAAPLAIPRLAPRRIIRPARRAHDADFAQAVSAYNDACMKMLG